MEATEERNEADFSQWKYQFHAQSSDHRILGTKLQSPPNYDMDREAEKCSVDSNFSSPSTKDVFEKIEHLGEREAMEENEDGTGTLCAQDPPRLETVSQRKRNPHRTIQRYSKRVKRNDGDGDWQASRRILLNVGGTYFETTLGTLAKCNPSSKFGRMFAKENFHALYFDEEDRHSVFVDFDPSVFSQILLRLRVNGAYDIGNPPDCVDEKIWRLSLIKFGVLSERKDEWRVARRREDWRKEYDVEEVRKSTEKSYKYILKFDHCVSFCERAIVDYAETHFDPNSYEKIRDLSFIAKIPPLKKDFSEQKIAKFLIKNGRKVVVKVNERLVFSMHPFIALFSLESVAEAQKENGNGDAKYMASFKLVYHPLSCNKT